MRDCTSGYRCYSREALEKANVFDIRSSGYSFLEEMVWRVNTVTVSGPTCMVSFSYQARSLFDSEAEKGERRPREEAK